MVHRKVQKFPKLDLWLGNKAQWNMIDEGNNSSNRGFCTFPYSSKCLCSWKRIRLYPMRLKFKILFLKLTILCAIFWWNKLNIYECFFLAVNIITCCCNTICSWVDFIKKSYWRAQCSYLRSLVRTWDSSQTVRCRTCRDLLKIW